MDKIIQFLDSVFKPILGSLSGIDPTGVNKVGQFLAELSNQKNDPNVNRLCLSIAIDLKVNNADPNVYFSIIKDIDQTLTCSLPEKFHKATMDDAYYCSLLPDALCSATKDQYVRVMQVSSFKENYVPSLQDPILNIGNDPSISTNPLYLNTNTVLPFVNTKRTMRGVKNCAWVLPHSALSNLVNSDFTGDWADIFVDQAGFYIVPFPPGYDVSTEDPAYTYMYLVYPNDFNEPVYKPLSIHADWRDPFPFPYISSDNMDGWGQTHNINPLEKRESVFLERIHLPFFLFSSSKGGNTYDIKAFGGSTLKKEHHFPTYLKEAYLEAFDRFNALS